MNIPKEILECVIWDSEGRLAVKDAKSKKELERVKRNFPNIDFGESVKKEEKEGSK